MKEIEHKQSLPSGDDVMNYKGLSAYLKLSQSSLRHKVIAGTIPSLKIDGAVRFSKIEIDEWLKGHKRKTSENKTIETETPENETDLFSADGGEA
jgi:excisionase family DNA binding protein